MPDTGNPIKFNVGKYLTLEYKGIGTFVEIQNQQNAEYKLKGILSHTHGDHFADVPAIMAEPGGATHLDGVNVKPLTVDGGKWNIFHTADGKL